MAEFKILYCEDTPVNQILIRKLAEKRGYDIDIAENGAVGVQMAKDNDYDLILMDIQMPEMDGLEAARTIRQFEGEKHTPILAVTANVATANKEVCFEAGMDDFLSKPFTPDQFYELVEKFLK